MAPRKGKFLGKRNNLKIKSKLNTRKRGLKLMKKNKASEKPLENLKWLRPMSDTSVVNQNKTASNWFDGHICKHGRISCGSGNHSVPQREGTDGKSSSTECSEASENSDECHCLYPKYTENSKMGILKRKVSSTDSVVAKYIKSGMDHVASFIVESAIRFGEQHGVIVADKNDPNVYEVVTPITGRSDDKCRRIRFKLTKKKKHDGKNKWRKGGGSGSRIDNCFRKDVHSHSDVDSKESEDCCSKSSSWSSKTDSLEDILPLLEKLKEDGEIVTSEQDLDILKRVSDDDCQTKRERLRDRHKLCDKRYKSVGAASKNSEEDDYTSSKFPWKKRLRRDSVDLAKMRPRATTCPRKNDSLSPLPF